MTPKAYFISSTCTYESFSPPIKYPKASKKTNLRVSLFNFWVYSGMRLIIYRMYGYFSLPCPTTNWSAVVFTIFKKALHAIYMIPGNYSFINSNNFFTTVFKKVQLFLKNVGYWPTTYIIQDAITALFYLPFLFSHKWSKVLKDVIKKFFSYFYSIDPHNEPTIHDKLFNASNEKLSLFCCPSIWAMINFFISGQSTFTKYDANYFII